MSDLLLKCYYLNPLKREVIVDVRTQFVRHRKQYFSIKKAHSFHCGHLENFCFPFVIADGPG
jgi:hypothetical protein